jgi:hypothetical protein
VGIEALLVPTRSDHPAFHGRLDPVYDARLRHVVLRQQNQAGNRKKL